ncbi:MAG: DnaJ domain-containing protein [Candidatus Limnocylindria bacterium]
MQPELDAYKVLQVDPCAEVEVIRAAYRALARRYHPDGSQPDAQRMAHVNSSYARLRDQESRRRYDASRSVRLSSVTPMGPGRPVHDPADGGSPTVLDFGRYAGWRLIDLARRDPDYLRWLARHSSGIRFREQIARLIPNEPDLNRRANSVA